MFDSFLSKGFVSEKVCMAVQLVPLALDPVSQVQILLEAEFNLWLYRASLHRAFHCHLFHHLSTTQTMLKGCKTQIIIFSVFFFLHENML